MGHGARDLVAGKFEVLRRIAAGGMAQVFLAASRPGTAAAGSASSLDDYVVLKMILPALTTDRRFVALFLDEARVLAMLDHPNIVAVVDVGSADGVPFIAMEYLHGQNLRHLAVAARRRHNQVPLDVALGVVTCAAEALHYAHTRSDPEGRPLHIVHRDVTPHNIVVTYDGRIKVIDFGIAKAASQTREPTAIGELRGKLRYFAPEQVLTAPVDARTDVFALGLILYELTTLRRAFPQSTEEAVLMAVSTGDVPAPRSFAADYPRALEDVVMRALATRPADRFQTAAELAAAVTTVAADLGAPRPSRERLSAYVRDLFSRELERSALNNARPGARTAIRANPWARPSEDGQPSTELVTHLESDPIHDADTAFEIDEDDTALGYAWMAEDPRDAVSEDPPFVDTGDVVSVPASVDTVDGTVPVTERTATLASSGTAPLSRPAAVLAASLIAVVAIVVVAIAVSLGGAGGERSLADVAKTADAADAEDAVDTVDAGGAHAGDAADAVDAVDTVDAGGAHAGDAAAARDAVDVDAAAAAAGAGPAGAAASDRASAGGAVATDAAGRARVADDEDAGAKDDGSNAEKHRRRPALPPLADNPTPAASVAWLAANCRTRVACADEMVAQKRALKTAALDVVRAFPGAVAQCVRQCLRSRAVTR